MNDKEVIKSLTEKQRKNLLKAYEEYKKTGFKHEDKGRRLGTNLRTGNALWRKGLVALSSIQLTNWSMWEITEKGIHIAETMQS